MTVVTLSRSMVRHGDRWILVTGCNVRPGAADLGRVEADAADLRILLDGGARVAVLCHQGSTSGYDAMHLTHVAELLGRFTDTVVAYEPSCTGAAARGRAAALVPGEAVLFGNTRRHQGEGRADDKFAAELAMLGDRVVVGGFSKAHRRHASNYLLPALLPSVAGSGLIAETERLRHWKHPMLAVVGGRKIEKITLGLAVMGRSTGIVIPTGTVLNAVLAAQGRRVGRSSLGDDPSRALRVCAEVLGASDPPTLALPSHVVVAPADDLRVATSRVVLTGSPVDDDWAIVDVVLGGDAAAAIRRTRSFGGRAVVAGPPGIAECGFDRGGAALVAALSDPMIDTILVGGDTVASMSFSGPTSTGGGSALYFLAHDTLPLFDLVDYRGTVTSRAL